MNRISVISITPIGDQVRPVRSDVGRTVRARLSTKAAVINSSIATGPKYPLGVGSKIGNAHDLDRACHLASTYESWRSEVSLATKMWVISGREAPRPRNTTPSPYPAPCRAGSRDGQFGGNALGRACSLTCRSNRRNHTAGTSEALAMSLQVPRTLRTLLMRDRCQLERDAHGNTVWSEIARSTPAARRY
jgi:hypothetical protein